MKTIVLLGFKDLNKVKLDKGFKAILGIGLKQGKELTEQLLENEYLEITSLTDEQVSKFAALAKEANAEMRIV